MENMCSRCSFHWLQASSGALLCHTFSQTLIFESIAEQQRLDALRACWLLVTVVTRGKRTSQQSKEQAMLDRCYSMMLKKEKEIKQSNPPQKKQPQSSVRKGGSINDCRIFSFVYTQRTQSPHSQLNLENIGSLVRKKSCSNYASNQQLPWNVVQPLYLVTYNSRGIYKKQLA